MANNLTDLQIERWRNLSSEASSDLNWVAYYQERDSRRRAVKEQIVMLINRYLSEGITIEEFKATFHLKTGKEWDAFSLKGMSGAMFLNTLVKYIPDQEGLSERLRSVLALPQSSEQGQQKMSEFIGYINNLIESNQITRRQIQPSRVPFFISAMWHMQSTDQWPIIYISARNALEADGLYSQSDNLVEDYFAFRDAFLSLASGLGLTSWELEHLCRWYEAHPGGISVPLINEPPGTLTNANESMSSESVDSEIADKEIATNEPAPPNHTQVQWLLAKIGKKLGCRVWIAANDHNKEWQGERLGDLSLKDMPYLGMVDLEVQRIISLIDVLWIKGTIQIAAAFEVEQTTSIYSGLLRMSDLVVLVPILNFPLYIIAPLNRMDQVRRELSRPTFQALELHRRCGYFSSEDFVKEAENIMFWASSPSAIDRLARKVEDVNEKESFVAWRDLAN